MHMERHRRKRAVFMINELAKRNLLCATQCEQPRGFHMENAEPWKASCQEKKTTCATAAAIYFFSS